MDRGFGNENILSLNELKYVCHIKLVVNVSTTPQNRDKRLIKEFGRELQDGETRVSSVYYKGKVPIQLVISRDSRYEEPLALAVSPYLSLPTPELAMHYYRKRMQIEETKSLHLNIEGMPKTPYSFKSRIPSKPTPLNPFNTFCLYSF